MKIDPVDHPTQAKVVINKSTFVIANKTTPKHQYTPQQYMEKICNRAPSSPLCHNDKLYSVLESIANQYNAPIRMILGIMSKESGFGTLRHHTNKDDCKETTYNRHGSKANNTPNGTKRTTKVGPGCWLQKYDSIEEGFTSLARTIGVGYKACLSLDDPVTCMAYKYVGNPKIAESSRVNHVNSFK